MSIQENKQLSLWSVKGYAFINIEMAQLLQPEAEATDPAYPAEPPHAAHGGAGQAIK